MAIQYLQLMLLEVPPPCAGAMPIIAISNHDRSFRTIIPVSRHFRWHFFLATMQYVPSCILIIFQPILFSSIFPVVAVSPSGFQITLVFSLLCSRPSLRHFMDFFRRGFPFLSLILWGFFPTTSAKPRFTVIAIALSRPRIISHICSENNRLEY